MLVFPFKTASSYAKQYLAEQSGWKYTSVWEYTQGGSRFPNVALWQYLKQNHLLTYKIILVERDPIEWTVSSYKFINFVQNGSDQNQVQSLDQHIEMMIQGNYPSINWQYHACVFPQDYYIPKITNYLNINQIHNLSWFNKDKNKINSTTEFPDPVLTVENIQLLEMITKPRYQYLAYTFADSLKRWQLRQDSNL